MLAIVLSGGGAKGAYEIGVWKALKKNRIHYDIVTGTSVGALNGTMMIQGNYHYATKVWKKIDQSQILERENFEDKNDMLKFYAKSGLKGGAEVNGLEKIMAKAINEKKFFKSKINFGIVTFNLSKLKPLELEKKDIKKGLLKDYVIASATCFPFFKKKKIDGLNYIDGGFYDNLPINLAVSLGATEVIAVDLKAIGLKKKVKNDNIKITYISPNNDTGSFLDFDETGAKRNINLGFNDAMKVFGKLDGTFYTFKKKHLNKNYNKYFDLFYKNVLSIFGKINDIDFFEDFINDKKDKDIKKQYFNNIVEACGKTMGLEEDKIYRIKKYNKELLIQLKIDNKLDKSLSRQKNKISEIMDLLSTQNFISKLKRQDLFNHEEVIMAIYLYTISKHDIII